MSEWRLKPYDWSGSMPWRHELFGETHEFTLFNIKGFCRCCTPELFNPYSMGSELWTQYEETRSYRAFKKWYDHGQGD